MENLAAIILAGCSLTAALAKQPDGVWEAKLLDKTQSAARHVMEEHVYIDMDHDGAKELIGVYLDGPYHVWYCSSDGQTCMPVYQNENRCGWDGCTLEALDIGEETHIVVNAFLLLGTNKTYTILAMRDKKMECLIADNYGYVWMSDEGDILLDVEDYDGMYEPGDGVMKTHTWMDTYLFYDDGTYKEYGATRITEEEFLIYQNAQALKDKIEAELKQPDTVSMEYSYFRRRNGIIHIQCDVEADSGVIRFGYYTVRYKDNILEEEPGTYNPGRMWEGGFSWLETVY